METAKSKTLLNIARVLVGLSVVMCVGAAFVSPPGGEKPEWNTTTIFFLLNALINLAVLFFLYKKHKVLSGILIIIGYVYMVVDTVIYAFDVPYLLFVSCLLSPPLISGILLIISGNIIGKAKEGSTTQPSESPKN